MGTWHRPVKVGDSVRVARNVTSRGRVVAQVGEVLEVVSDVPILRGHVVCRRRADGKILDFPVRRALIVRIVEKA